MTPSQQGERAKWDSATWVALFLGKVSLSPVCHGGSSFYIQVNADCRHLPTGRGSTRELVTHWLFYSSERPYYVRMTNSKLQIWKSKAQRGEATCPSRTETIAQWQSETRVPSTLPEPARRQGAPLPAPARPHPIEKPHLPHPGLRVPIRITGEGGHSHLWLPLAPSVPNCVTDGRGTRVGAGVSPRWGAR